MRGWRTLSLQARQLLAASLALVAFLGFTGYALCQFLSVGADYLKLTTESFGAQLSLELFAAFSLGFSMMVLQGGLLVALLFMVLLAERRP